MSQENREGRGSRMTCPKCWSKMDWNRFSDRWVCGTCGQVEQDVVPYPVEAERAAIASLPSSRPTIAVLGPALADALAAWRALSDYERNIGMGYAARMVADALTNGGTAKAGKVALDLLRAAAVQT